MAKLKKRAGKRSKRRSKQKHRKVARWQDRKDIIQLVIKAKCIPCMDCAYPCTEESAPFLPEGMIGFPYWVMDFDHRPGVKKRGNVSAMARDPAFSLEDVIKEMAKCDICCSNCHRDRTYKREIDPKYRGPYCD